MVVVMIMTIMPTMFVVLVPAFRVVLMRHMKRTVKKYGVMVVRVAWRCNIAGWLAHVRHDIRRQWLYVSL